MFSPLLPAGLRVGSLCPAFFLATAAAALSGEELLTAAYPSMAQHTLACNLVHLTAPAIQESHVIVLHAMSEGRNRNRNEIS